MKKILLSSILLFGAFQIATAQLYDSAGTKDYTNNRAPINNALGSLQDGSYCQMIYFPSEVAADTLFGIQFESHQTIPQANFANSKDWEVWIAETSQASYGAYITTGLTKVFDGEIRIVGNKFYIYFDQYHIYSGTQNLVVGIVEKTNGQAGTTFQQSNIGTARVSKIRTFNAPGPFDALNPNTGGPTFDYNPGVGTGMYGRPFTEFIISEPCETPTNIAASPLLQNSANIVFDGLNGNNWTIDYKLGSSSSYTSVTATDTFNNPINSLARFTTYDVNVTANCGVFGTSEPSADVSFTTKRCDSIHTNINESFEPSGGPLNQFTTGCWSTLDGPNPSFRTSSPTAHDGTWYIRVPGANDILVLPELDQIGRGTLTFWANSNNNLSRTQAVGYVTDPKDPTTFVSVENINKSGGFSWQSHTVDFSNYISQAYDKKYIALRSSRAGMNYDLIQFNPDTAVSEFVQDFENMTPFQGVDEEGWIGYLGSATGNYGSLAFGEVTPSTTSFSGNDELHVFHINFVSYLTSPKVTTTNKRLQFAARLLGPISRPIYVGTVNSISLADTASFIPYDTIIPTSTNVQYTVDLSNSTLTNGHIAFKLPATSNSINNGIILDLIEFGQPDVVVNDSLCSGDSIVLSNQVVRNTGTYLDTLQGTGGDSIVQYNATFFAGSNDTLFVEVCDSIISPTGKIWRTAGTFYDTIPGAAGCDNLFTYFITKSVPASVVTAPSFCFGDSMRVTINPSDPNVEYTFASANPNVQFRGGVPKAQGNGGALTLASNNFNNRDYLAQIIGSRIDSFPPNAIDLKGTTDRISHSMPNGLNYNQSFTVEAWMNVSDTFATNRKPFFFAGPAGGNNTSDIEFYVFDNTTKTIYLLFNRSGAFRATAQWNNVMLFNQWFHIAVSYDHSAGNATLYMNGVSQGTVTIGSVTQRSNSTIAWGAIDQAGFGTLNGFNDKIDQMRIWNDARTAAEIMSNRNTCMNGTESDLVVNFTADEGSGNTIVDNVNGVIANINNSTSNTWISGGIKCGVVSCIAVVDTFNIDVDSVNIVTTQNGLTLTASATGASYQWIDCANNTAVAGATNQSFTAMANGSYAVEVTENGCADTSTCIPVIGVGINNVDLNNAFNLYPNPTNDWVNIQSDVKIEAISIISIQGRRVMREFSTNKINLSSLSKGYYFVEIETTKGTVRKKIVKQ